MCQFEHGIAQFPVADLQAAAAGLTEVVFEAKMSFIKSHRAVKIGDMNGDMIDALEHTFLLGSKHRLFTMFKARVIRHVKNSARGVTMLPFWSRTNADIPPG